MVCLLILYLSKDLGGKMKKKFEDMTKEERDRWAENYANGMTLMGVGLVVLALILKLSGVID